MPQDPTARHPLLDLLLSAAGGGFPPVDGQVEFLPLLRLDLQAVVSFTGHAFVATSRAQSEFADLPIDGFGQVLQPAFLQRLAGPHGPVGVTDALLVTRGLGGGHLPERTDLEDHPRVRHARALREEVHVFGDRRGLVTLAQGPPEGPNSPPRSAPPAKANRSAPH